MLTILAVSVMTGQMLFDSHIENLLASTVLLSNRLYPGRDGGHPVAGPDGDAALRTAVRDVLRERGYRLGRQSVAVEDAHRIADAVAVSRTVIEAIDAGDLGTAARLTNGLLLETGARPARPRRGRRLGSALPRTRRLSRRRLVRRHRGGARDGPGDAGRGTVGRVRGGGLRPGVPGHLPQRRPAVLLHPLPSRTKAAAHRPAQRPPGCDLGSVAWASGSARSGST